MISRFALVPLALVALLTLSACDSSGPDAIGVTGVWEGVVFDPVVEGAPRYPVTVRMTDNGVEVAGQGTVRDIPEGDLAFFIDSGSSFVEGRLFLRLAFDRAPFIGSLSGVLVNEDPGIIEGTLQGSGSARGDFQIELRSRDV
ncbi:hypothetical protein [Rubrivirga sp.]|uniref:hypothetical protein n=1 Tax=Rubrivirga sp. TaxID=1885344 RepID=UPI003C78D663